MASVGDAAAVGAAQTAALLAVRERELGMTDSGYLARAHAVATGSPVVQQAVGLLLEIADTLPTRGGVPLVPDDIELRRMQTASRNRDTWTDHLRARADQDALSAYLWLGFNCAYVPTAEHAVERWLTILPMWRETPLVLFKAATCSSYTDRAALVRLVEAAPRFIEIHYFLNFGFAFTGRIDEAIDHLLKAYAWRPRWPAVTDSLGIDYLAIDEFDRAIDFLDRTLALVPNHSNAILNKARALTYAGEFAKSLDTLEPLLTPAGSLEGDARYWLALNEWHLGRYDEAWQSIELAAPLLFSAAVPKLAGIIAYNRKQLEVSRKKFEQSRQRDRTDCETGFYLGIVLAELAMWARAVDLLLDSVSCFEKAEAKLNQEIAAIRASTQPVERKDRQVKRREDEIASNERRVVTSWYNTAISYFNRSRKDDARQFATKVAADEEFGQRARELLARLQ